MTTLEFTVPVSIAEIVIPVVSAGIFLPGFFLFGYLLHKVRDRLYSRTLLLMGVGFLYLVGEVLVVLIGGVAHNFPVAVQFSRFEQLVVLWLIPVVPFYLGGVLTTPSQFPGVNRALIYAGLALASVITVLAFVSPDTFRSVSTLHRMAGEIESTYGRGAGGPLTDVRNIALLVMIVYGNVLIVLEVISFRKSRFSITLVVGGAVALGFGVVSILDSLAGPFAILVPWGIVGFALFVLASMMGASWRFVDDSREVELAHAELVQHENRLSYLAYHDQLTGARNRKAFYEVLANRSHSAASGAADGFALLYIDLDYFKQVNDTYGHRTGDSVLRRVAETLKGAVRHSDELFRIGGDEFALIVGTLDGSELRTVSQKILRNFEHPLSVDNREFVVGASIGAAIMPNHTTSVEDLVAKADVALYHAKKERNTFRLYNTDMDGGISDSSRVYDLLRKSLEDGAIGLAYQPIVNTEGKPEGYEALLRWQPWAGSALSNERIVELANTTGLIGQLGAVVIGRAVSDVAPAIAAGLASYVSVNVAPRELAARNFPELVHSAARRHNVSVEQIHLEMPESGIVTSLPAGGARLVAAVNEGLHFVVDDFGKGYSSLGYLSHLPIHTVKLDRALVAEITEKKETLALIRGVVTMAAELGIDSVAVGVETSEQFELLRSLGCSRFQGFLTGRPGPSPP